MTTLKNFCENLKRFSNLVTSKINILNFFLIIFRTKIGDQNISGQFEIFEVLGLLSLTKDILIYLFFLNQASKVIF